MRPSGLPVEFHRFFWDHPPATLDLERHASLILERLLDHGDLAAARWALATFGERRIREFLLTRGHRTLSRKTIAFWRARLGLEDEPCLQPSSLASSRPFWTA
jgi:hypothetical protein